MLKLNISKRMQPIIFHNDHRLKNSLRLSKYHFSRCKNLSLKYIPIKIKQQNFSENSNSIRNMQNRIIRLQMPQGHDREHCHSLIIDLQILCAQHQFDIQQILIYSLNLSCFFSLAYIQLRGILMIILLYHCGLYIFINQTKNTIINKLPTNYKSKNLYIVPLQTTYKMIKQQSHIVLSKKFQPHFPVAKVKKMIQENQQIGKVSNLIPPLIQKAMELFLIDLITKSSQVGNQSKLTRLTPYCLKKALQNLKQYKFLFDVLQDVEETVPAKPTKLLECQSKKRPRKSVHESEDCEGGKRNKKGRKKQFIGTQSSQSNNKQQKRQ